VEETSFVESSSPQQSVSDSSPAPASPAPASQPAQTEKQLPQSQVNAIVQRIKAEERAKYEGMMSNQHSNQQQVAPAQFNQSNQGNVGFGGIDDSYYRRIAVEETQKHLQNMQQQTLANHRLAQGQRIAADFMSKLEADKGRYNDFDEVVGSVPFVSFPNSVALANEVTGTADVMYELSKNPAKLDRIESLAQRDPTLTLARREMKLIAESIAINQAAQNVRTASGPLEQIKHSPTNTDNGGMSVRDFQKLFKSNRRR
jgi:hypothetical protein